jgi:transcriptional regulator with XRE-family HTH domain
MVATQSRGGGALGSLNSDFRNFRKRLKIVIQNTADTQVQLSELMTERHAKVSQSTISRWMRDDDEAVPTVKELMALLMSHKEISVDWLMGRKPAESIAEKYMESRL